MHVQVAHVNSEPTAIIGSDKLSHFGQFQRNLTQQLVKYHGKGNSSLLNQRTVISLKGGLFRITSNFFSIFK